MELHSQQKTLDMQRGLFLIKYESSEDTRNPPTVRVSADEGSESSIELILPPDADGAVLWSPGASLVVRAIRNARLRLVVAAGQPSGSTAARVQVVALSQDPAGTKERELSAPLDLSGFRVLGHVAGRGDVVVDADNWVGGPLAPSRIEGFAIQWPDKPPDLILRHAVTIGGPRPTMGPLVEAGNFTGTRGRALPIVGATVEISGAAAHGQQIVVDLIFLGSPQMRVAGQRVVLSGPTGREPLVGLRVRIEAVDQSNAVRPASGATQPRQNENVQEFRPVQQSSTFTVVEEGESEKPAGAAVPAAAKRTGRVRVFRSQNRKSHG